MGNEVVYNHSAEKVTVTTSAFSCRCCKRERMGGGSVMKKTETDVTFLNISGFSIITAEI